MFRIPCNGLRFKGAATHFDFMISLNFQNVFGGKTIPGLFFFGGGGGQAPKPEKVKMPEMPQMQMPAPPPPPPPVPPPPTVSNMDASQAASDQKQQAARRKGVRSTLIAGESTGAMSTGGDSGRKTLLG